MSIAAARTRTRLGHWARVWESMEDQGMPVDSREAASWDKRHDDVQGQTLVSMLDLLQDRDLPMGAIELIGESVIAAFKMGRQS